MSTYKDNPFEVLGVSKNASKDEIKQAYRKMALKYHPDRHKDDASRAKAQDMFVKIAAAYEILMDDKMRRDYEDSVRPASNYPSSSSSKTSSNRSSSTPGPAFRPVFHDPYEVFLRNFRDIFGFEYPGAAYDYIDPNEPTQNYDSNTRRLETSSTPSASNQKQLKNSPEAPVSPGKLSMKERLMNASPFKKNNDNTVPRSQRGVNNNNTSTSIVPREPQPYSSHTPAGPFNSNSTQLAVRQENALIAAPGRNNRPTEMKTKVTVDKNGVTTTEITMKRPDGTEEKAMMKTGIPGPAPGKKQDQGLQRITNGSSKPLLTNGNSSNNRSASNGYNPRLSNGDEPPPKLLTNGGQQPESPKRLTNGSQAPMLDNKPHNRPGWLGVLVKR